MVSVCKHCEKPIKFFPHPKNPSSLAPFDILPDGSQGEIHFASCKKKSKGREFKTAADLSALECKHGHDGTFVIMSETERLAAYCEFGHFIQWISKTDAHADLLTITNPLGYAEPWRAYSASERYEILENYDICLDDWSKEFLLDVKTKFGEDLDKLSDRQKLSLEKIWYRCTKAPWGLVSERELFGW